jgi:uncharacterized membrane protein YbhN (UPF0104 family)
VSAEDPYDGDGAAALPSRGLLASVRSPRLLVALAVGGAVVALAWLHRATVDAGGDSLAAADLQWLALGLVATAALLIAGTVTQLGSMPVRPPVHQVLAVQLAANFANHISPAGSGGIGINIRFLRRRGLTWSTAASAMGLNSLAGLITHVLLLLAALVVSPTVVAQLRRPASWREGFRGLAVAAPYAGMAAAALAVAAVLAVALSAKWRTRLRTWAGSARGKAAREVRVIAGVLRDPYRAAALWLGALSTPLLHALVLFAVLRSLDVSLAIGTTVVVYLAVSALSALIPSPGGVGALDATLLAGLVAVGVSSPLAMAAVLGYRLITVWIPLLPGALALTVLLHRRII